jgi:uncharacterized repeat protein (TIGR01451 family)
MAKVVARYRWSACGSGRIEAKDRTARTTSVAATALALALLVGRAPTLHGQSAFGGVETPIVVAPGDQIDSHISGAVVQWTDTSSGNADIYYSDGIVHRAVAAPGDQQLGEVSGTTIVYTEHAGGVPGEIFTYDIPTGTVTNISNDASEQTNPAISSTLIAWEDYRFGVRHIGVYDRITHTTKIIGDLSSSQYGPRVSGTNVVFTNEDANPLNWSIVVFDNQSGIMTTLFAGEAWSPDIDGAHVVWVTSNGVGEDIVVHDLSTGAEKRLANSGNVARLRISGEFVAFEDWSTGVAHVVLWHWPGGETFTIPTSPNSAQWLPGISGNRVVYSDNRNGSSHIYAFDFTFSPPLVSLSTGTVAFGNQQVGIARRQTMTISNGGNGRLDVASLSFSTPDFYSTTPLPFSVLSGGSASIDIWFNPTATGVRTGTMTIADNSLTSPETVAFNGNGVNPIATVTPTSINFGNQQVNTTSAANAVTVTNTGVGTLTISGASLAGVNPEDFSFTLSPAPPVSLQPGQAVVFGVRFTPRVTGIRTATFQLTTNALNSGQSTFLTGNGILPADVAIAMSAKATPPNRLSDTSTLTYTIQVSNTSPNGAYNVNVTAGVPTGTTFISAVTSQGSCKLVKPPLGAASTSCSLGTLAGAATATVVVTTSYPGTIPANKATVASLLDPNSANNTASTP